MTRSRSAERLGVQVPQFEYRPRARSSAGQEAVELAASAGLILEPHQSHVLEGALGEGPDGRWAAFEVGVVEPRQNGKGGIITARELAGLYLFGEELQTHTAHRFDTCLEGFRRIRDLIVNTPDLSRRLRKNGIVEAHGQEAIELQRPTQRLIFKARSKGSGRGFSGDAVYLDEAFWLMDLGSMMPTMSARPNPQLWYLSSAPLPRVESDTLRRLCRRGRAGATGKARPRRLYYAEWCARIDADPADREAWQAEVTAKLDDPLARTQANPGLGFRLSEEFMESERAAMTDEDYARERLGIYPEEQEVADPVIPPADWQACRSEDSEIVKPVVYAFEVSMDRKWSVIAAAGRSSEVGTHVEIGDNRQGTGWVVKRLLELQQKHAPTAIVCNPHGPAGGLLAACEKAGVKVGIPNGRNAEGEVKLRSVTSSDYAQACAAAYDAIVEHQWRHLGQGELDKAAGKAEKRQSGSTWVFDERGAVDISPLRAVTLAAWVSSLRIEEPEKVVSLW